MGSVRQCYWTEGQLVVVTNGETFRLVSTEAVKALKRNWFDPHRAADRTGPADAGTSESPAAGPLFDPDSPRRMLLIQEHLSGIRD